VRLDLPNDIPASSVWIVCDLTTGGFSVAAPAEYKVKSSVLPAAALRSRSGGNSARIEVTGEQELFYVRPGIGAWRLTGEHLVLDTMIRVGSSPPPPDDFRAGDLLFVADPMSMTIRTLRIR
jgi:hypothetical protein